MKIGYARVSTPDQSLDAQKNALIEYGVSEDRVYTDVRSGATTEREGRRKAFEQLRHGDVLVVQRIDRIGRSLSDFAKKMDELHQIGADLVALEQGIDTSTATGEMIAKQFALMAEWERLWAKERTQEGLQAARKKGNVPGRPPALEEDELRQIKILMEDEDVPASTIYEKYDIDKSTLYRYFAPDGTPRQPAEHAFQD